MNKLLLTLVLAAGCAHAVQQTPPRNPQGPKPCLEEKVPARALLEVLEGPTPVSGVDANGKEIHGINYTITPESGITFFKYVGTLEEIAKHAETGCVAK